MKLGMYIMAPEPISAAYFINPFHQSVCLYVCMFIPRIVARQRIGKIVFLLSLLGNGWVKTLPLQRIHT
jgi:hypothetical protein